MIARRFAVFVFLFALVATACGGSKEDEKLISPPFAPLPSASISSTPTLSPSPAASPTPDATVREIEDIFKEARKIVARENSRSEYVFIADAGAFELQNGEYAVAYLVYLIVSGEIFNQPSTDAQMTEREQALDELVAMNADLLRQTTGKIIVAHPKVQIVQIRVYYPSGIIVDWIASAGSVRSLLPVDSDGAWLNAFRFQPLQIQPAPAQDSAPAVP